MRPGYPETEKKSQKVYSEIFKRDKIIHTPRLVCFEETLKDSALYDHYHLTPPRQLPPLPPPPPLLLVENR